MRRIYVSSLNRVADPNEEGDLGKLYVLDYDTKKIVPHPVEGEAINIGRSRGIRGICFFENEILVAGVTNKMSAYDPDTMQLKRTWEEERAKYLHQIRVGPGPYGPRLHLISTGNDLELVYPSCFYPWYLEQNKAIIDPYVTHPNTPPWGEDRLHFNSVAWDENGDEYHLYNSTRMIFNFTKREVFYHGGALHGAHDLVITEKEIITNSSGDRTTLAIDRKTKDVRVIHKNRRLPSSEANLHGMTRGLAIYKDLLFIGSTPGDITVYKGLDFLENIVLSTDKRESIFDILLDPRDWPY